MWVEVCTGRISQARGRREVEKRIFARPSSKRVELHYVTFLLLSIFQDDAWNTPMGSMLLIDFNADLTLNNFITNNFNHGVRQRFSENSTVRDRLKLRTLLSPSVAHSNTTNRLFAFFIELTNEVFV